MVRKTLILAFTFLLSGYAFTVHAQNHVRDLVKNLLIIGYPINKDEVISLDNMAMKFNSENRISVLKKILMDRKQIHKRTDIDYIIRTDIILDSLCLLDELELPVIRNLIEKLTAEGDWEKREKAQLVYMAAKRDINYQSNRAVLLSELSQYQEGMENDYGENTGGNIIDIMNCISYLSDLFIYKGDTAILDSLIRYSSRSYGLPSEYSSHMFVNMFLMRPDIFVSDLASKDDQTITSVINTVIFGIRNNQVKTKFDELLSSNKLSTSDIREKHFIALFSDKFKSQDFFTDKK